MIFGYLRFLYCRTNISRVCMKTKKILITAGIILTAIVITKLITNKKAAKKRLRVVADEGYETAEDILFPKRKFLRLG
jgi:hypothetical protein